MLCHLWLQVVQSAYCRSEALSLQRSAEGLVTKPEVGSLPRHGRVHSLFGCYVDSACVLAFRVSCRCEWSSTRAPLHHSHHPAPRNKKTAKAALTSWRKAHFLRLSPILCFFRSSSRCGVRDQKFQLYSRHLQIFTLQVAAQPCQGCAQMHGYPFGCQPPAEAV